MYTPLVINMATVQLNKHNTILDAFQANMAGLVHMFLISLESAKARELILRQSTSNIAIIQFQQLLIGQSQGIILTVVPIDPPPHPTRQKVSKASKASPSTRHPPPGTNLTSPSFLSPRIIWRASPINLLLIHDGHTPYGGGRILPRGMSCKQACGRSVERGNGGVQCMMRGAVAVQQTAAARRSGGRGGGGGGGGGGCCGGAAQQRRVVRWIGQTRR